MRGGNPTPDARMARRLLPLALSLAAGCATAKPPEERATVVRSQSTWAAWDDWRQDNRWVGWVFLAAAAAAGYAVASQIRGR